MKSIGMIRNPIYGKIKNGNQTTQTSKRNFTYAGTTHWVVPKKTLNTHTHTQFPFQKGFSLLGFVILHAILCVQRCFCCIPGLSKTSESPDSCFRVRLVAKMRSNWAGIRSEALRCCWEHRTKTNGESQKMLVYNGKSY